MNITGIAKAIFSLIGGILGPLTTVIVLLFIISLLLGRGSRFVGFATKSSHGRHTGTGCFGFLKKLLLLPAVIIIAAFLLRGTFLKDAGGGFATDRNGSIVLNALDNSISIPNDANTVENFDHNLEYYIDHADSYEYNSELSHLLISLGNAVGDAEWFSDAAESMGFPPGKEYRRVNYDMSKMPVAYCICKKPLPDGKTLLLGVIRGTFTGEEMLSNADIEPDKSGRHRGFSENADHFYDALFDCLGDADLNKTVFVLTGHSRGAAIANIVASGHNIYCYCFACPDTAFLTPETAGSYKCIFNIGNVKDKVSWIPWYYVKYSGAKYGLSPDRYWEKYGQSYWFSTDNWSSVDYPGYDVHDQKIYFEILRKEPKFKKFKNKKEASTYIK